MASTSQLQILLTILAGLPGYNGPISFPVLQNLTSPASVQPAYPVASGANTLTPPSGTEWIVIYSAATSTTFTLKGVTGDTGYPTLGCLYVIQASTTATTLVLNASAPGTIFLAYI